MSVASLVTISRLKGYTYATAEEENQIFADFFASERSLNVGGIFYTTYEPHKISYLNHKVKLIVIYPYLVVSIKGNVKTDANLINFDCAVTSKSCTKVLLDASSIADKFNPAFHTTHCIEEIWPYLRSCSALSYCFVLLCVIASKPCLLDANLTSDGLSTQLKAYFNSCIYGADSSFEQELYKVFLPLLLSHQRQPTTTTFETILIDVKGDSPRLFGNRVSVVFFCLFTVFIVHVEVGRKLEILSNQLGVSFIELESRYTSLSLLLLIQLTVPCLF